MKKSQNYFLTKMPASLVSDLEGLVAFGSGMEFMKLSLAQFKDKKVIFISDEKIIQKCTKFFPKNFTNEFSKVLLLKNPKADEKSLKKIAVAAKNCNFIIGLGSGTINDLCKFTSAQIKIPYAIFPSAASMNGYLSKNASITISGHKKTLSATLPTKVFCNSKILSSAPLSLTKAGIGDSLCFYSCWFDWYLSYKILGTKFDKEPFLMLEEKMNFFVKNFKKFSIRDEKFLELLIEILLLSGQGMTRAGGSYPASQSEHLIAHTIEMKYPKIVEKTLHGAQIAVTTLTSARLQKSLLKAKASHEGVVKNLEFITQTMSPNLNDGASLAINKKLQNFFGKKIAAQCAKEYAQKISQKPKEINWQKLKLELQKIYLDEIKLMEIFSHFKIKTSIKSLGLSKQQYQECVTYAKFIRNRFTCLDLTQDLFPN